MEEDEELVVLEYKNTYNWIEGSPSRLRQDLRLTVKNLLNGMPEGGTEADLVQLFERLKLQLLMGTETPEVDFRINNVSYSSTRFPFRWYSLKSDKKPVHKPLPRVEAKQDHIAFNICSSSSSFHNPGLVMRAYPLPDASNEQCRQLLRFIAACSMRANSVTSFVLPVLRIYESSLFTYHVFSRPEYGSIAGIMRSLTSVQSNKSTDGRNQVGSPLPPQYTLYFSACILQALQFLTKEGIAMNCMTTESVTVLHSQIPVLMDFMCASRTCPEESHMCARQLPENPVGWDDSWPAPELLRALDGGAARLGRLDVWNFGTFVLMMSVGTEEFKHLSNTEHRAPVGQTSTAVCLQPCSQLASNRQCVLATLGTDLLHLLSVTMADSPSHRPTPNILQSLSYFAKVNFLNLRDQAVSFGLNLDGLLGYSSASRQQQQQPRASGSVCGDALAAEAAEAAAAAAAASRRAPQVKQLQMMEQLNDIDELLGRMGMQAVTVMEAGGD